MKKLISLFLTLAMVMSFFCGVIVSADSSDKKVTSVTLPDKSITLAVGDTYKVKPTLSPSDAANKKYTVSSSDKAVASVSKGVVTGVKEGTAKITVKASDGSGAKAVLTVKVTKGKASGKKPASEKKPSSKPASNVKTTGGFDAKKTSMQIASEMKVGWNLGNSLDALGTGLSSETAWGNPKTTKKMIDNIKAAGFNTVRIPVSWGKHCNADGVVEKAWMDRVKEVVDYAYDNDMYVILNSHHDNEYYDIGGCVKSDKTLEKSKKKMAKLWTQIANTFKDYDERLVFETLNEPRTEGSAKEWTGGTAPEREVVYTLNAEILSAIRATGGNNKLRSVMMPTYAATSSMSILKQMKFPDDDRIILSVHAYSPYNFAMNDKGSKNFTSSDRKELDNFFSDLNKNFVSKGIPVVIGECGTINKDNLDQRIDWAEYFVKGAKKYGIPCIWWDNNYGKTTGSETFGIYNRLSNKFIFPEIAEAFVKAAE